MTVRNNRTLRVSQDPRGMIDAMPITHLFAGVAVTDFESACAWYERLFGRPPDMLPQEGEAVWHLTAGASVYVTADLERAGSGLLTIAVSDLDAHAGALAERGVPVDRIVANRDTVRRVIVSDADGNQTTLFEDPAHTSG
jgi:predicted enzyme related to lactoylglutathione lyase